MADVRASTDVSVQGTRAHDAPAGDNPVLSGGRANQNEPAAVADGDAVYAWLDQQGRRVAVLNFPANAASDDTHGPKRLNLTAATNAAILAAPGAGQSIHVTHLLVGNQGAAKVRLTLVEGGADGGSDGTTRLAQTLAADGGGFCLKFDPPWKIAANTALKGRLSAAGDVDVNVHYFTAP